MAGFNMTGTDENIVFIEENRRFKLIFRLENKEMACLAEIEIFPIDIAVLDEADTEPVSLSEEIAKKESVTPDVVIEKSEPLITPPDLIWFLQQNNMTQTIDFSAVYEFCAAIELGMTPQATVLARGIEPIPGTDGWFDLAVKISGKDAEFTEDEDGHVDLRTRNAYSEIESGQKLGMVHPPQFGISGSSVYGLPIPAEPGQPFELIAGEGVVLKYDDRVAFAEKAGRALFEKKTISVVDLLVVSGDVDLSIGNIDFQGFVEVTGDVPDDFDIKTTKGIKVSGHIGACHIESDGSIEIGSMAGKDIGQIICRGDLKANYLNQATVLSYGDIYVNNEIRNSQIKSTGKIIVERGSIIGGKSTAMEGIEAKNLGTGSGQKTQLIAGIYFPDADRFDYLREQLKSINRQIESINEALVPLKYHLKKSNENVSATESRLIILNEHLDKLYAEKSDFSAEITASNPQEFSCSNPKINVLKSLMAGVFLTLGGNVEDLKIERSGPLTIIENSRDGGLRYLTLSPLQIMAAQIEEELLDEEDKLLKSEKNCEVDTDLAEMNSVSIH